MNLEFSICSFAVDVARRLSTNGTSSSGDGQSGTKYEGPLTGIIMAVFIGLTIFFVIIDCTRVLSPLSKYLCGRERSSLLSSMDDETYKRFLLNNHRYAGISPDCCSSGAWFMKPGAFEDFLRYVANEHHLLGSVLADRLHPYSRLERATAFLIMHSFIFLLTAAASTGNPTDYLIISILVISPMRIMIDELLYLLLAVPCSRNCCSCLRDCLDATGHCITGFLLIIGIFLFFVSAIIVSSAFPAPADQRLIVWNYLYTVFIVSAAEELFLMYLYFVDTDNCCCNAINKLTCGFLSVGAWNKETTDPEIVRKSVAHDIESPNAAADTPSVVQRQPPVQPGSPVVAYGRVVELSPQQLQEQMQQHHVVAPTTASPAMVVSGYTVA